MKAKLTKRIPFKFILNCPDGRILEKIVFTNDIDNFLKKYNCKTGYGIKWQLAPLNEQIIDGQKYFEDAIGNLRKTNP